jgi:hypothetical protein
VPKRGRRQVSGQGPALTPGQRLRQQLGGLDPRSVVTAAAALSLMPENAGALMRLGVIAEVAASIHEASGRPAVRPTTMRQLARGPEVSAVLVGREDPPEYPVVEPLGFEGAVYRVFSGVQQEELVTRSERLFAAVSRLADSHEWARDARQLIALPSEKRLSLITRSHRSRASPQHT